MKYKIEFNKEKCLGCGACTQCSNWELGRDDKANPKKTQLSDIGCNREAEDICPVNAIKIIEIK